MEDVCVDNSSNTCIYADVCDAYGKLKIRNKNLLCHACLTQQVLITNSKVWYADYSN